MVYRYSRQEKYEETQQDHITLRSEVQLLTLKTKQESDTEHYRCLTSRTHSVTKRNLPWSALKTGTLIKTSTQCRNRFLRGKAAELAFTHGKQRQAFSAGWTYTAWLFCQSPYLVQLPRRFSSKQIIQHSDLRSQPKGSWLALRIPDGGHQLQLLRQAQDLSSQRLK